jgi:hypothetical protein
MDRVSPELRAGMAGLSSGNLWVSADCGRCLQCGTAKPAVALVSYDIDQAFEACGSSLVLQGLDYFIAAYISKFGHDIIGVARGRLFGCSAARGMAPGRWHIFRMGVVRQALSWALLLSFVAVGPLVYKLAGLCIGGIVSKAGLSVVLGRLECLASTSSASIAGGPYDQKTFCQNVFVRRYVDDGLVFSRVFCPCCIRQFILDVYQGLPVSFPGSGDTHRWLDLSICGLQNGTLGVSLVNANREWLHGDGPRIKPNFIKCYGRPAFIPAYFSSIMGGRVARMLALELPSQAITERILEDCLELLILGYSERYVRMCVHNLRRSCPAVQKAQSVYRIFVKLGHLPHPRSHAA